MICPFCGNKIPDNSDECFVCGEDLRPKSVSEYYTDMDSVKKEDEGLYKKISKDMGTNENAMTPGQIRAIIVTAVLAMVLVLSSLDVFKYMMYSAGSAYDKKRGFVVGVHYIIRGNTERENLTTDCMVAYDYNGTVLKELVKAGFHYCIGDQITVYVDMEGKPYHFVFSIGDLLQLIIIACFTALVIIAIVRWHQGPNADGHLDRRLPGYMAGRSRREKNDKWWRYF